MGHMEQPTNNTEDFTASKQTLPAGGFLNNINNKKKTTQMYPL